jgi:hypothetical protein
MQQLDREGRLHFPKNPNGRLRLKMYLDESQGVPVQDLWTDILLPSTSKERVNWPTQKPVDLLKRIILSSSSEGAVVLDPFCGCGTTIVACEMLKRQWIGIDVARKAVDILETRFATESLPEPSIVWHPADNEAATALAERDPDQFEAWVRRKLRAEKRRNDRGIDGECFYKDDDRKSWHVIISVKGGHGLNPGMVRDLRGTIERENAPIGVLVCMYEPTDGMRLEATRAGFLPVNDVAGPIPRIQIVTVDQLFNERRPIRAPGDNSTPKAAPRLPQKGQTAMLFASPAAKVRPAQEARAKAKADRPSAPASAPSLPTRAAASGNSPSKPPSRPPSRPPSSRRGGH